ncbi:MAG: FAD-binding domain-containing protein [Chitinophagia bacterium]
MTLETILQQLDRFDPITYGKTRNFTNGAVTDLSPYVSRGFISTKSILEHLVRRGFKYYQLEKIIQQMAWREYFQRVWQSKGAAINIDLKNDQQARVSQGMPLMIEQASSGIDAIDKGINALKDGGHMHNHMRMYVAFLSANLAGFHWHDPAQWMYYHLLDGDWASNALSWQWVAGTFSHKKYIANQENINHYTRSTQSGTYLDHDYDTISVLSTPDELLVSSHPELKTNLPSTSLPLIDPNLPTLVYNYYNLSPTWRSHESANRILLLEPAVFEQYPVSDKCIDFALALSIQTPNMQIFTGSFSALKVLTGSSPIIFREHPLNRHYTGIADEREWLLHEPSTAEGSFFSFWKKMEKRLVKEYFH